MNMTEREKNAYDRGYADSYYHRNRHPHIRVDFKRDENLSQSEIAAYNMGYSENEQFGNKKEWC